MVDLTSELGVAIGWMRHHGVSNKQVEAVEAAAERINELVSAVREAVSELDADHYPYDPRTNTAAPDLWREIPDLGARLGCVMCWPGDGSWPCTSRMIADDLRKLIPEKEEHE